MKAKFLIALLLMSAVLLAEQAPPNEPQYTKEGQLIKPENYREWIYLSSGLGMTYGTPSANQEEPDFDNVFVTPQAYKSFLATGTWPDKAMMALEVRFSASKGSINKAGRFQEKLAGLEIHLKDEVRFPATKWAFFGFNGPETTAKPLAADSVCQKCHVQNGAVDETFVQFYPTLIPVAKARGTFKVEVEK
ncbi:MAG: cytochrome P460 family protein [Thermoanaerobaculia bacterium]